MGDYLKPWRRKIGVLSLVLACVCAAGWMRSRRIADSITYPVEKHRFDSLVSATGSLVWQRNHLVPQPAELEGAAVTGPISPIWQTSPISDEGADEDSGLIWSWRFCGFGIAGSPPEQDQELGMSATLLYLPYWSVVLPLALLASYLLLSKPQLKKPPVSAD